MRPVNLLLGITLAVFLAYSLGGCPTPTPKPPINDASDASPLDVVVDASIEASDSDDPIEGAAKFPECAKACSVLKFFGCPEATKPDSGKSCYRLCADTEEGGKFNLKPKCIGAALDIQSIRACGTVRCLKI